MSINHPDADSGTFEDGSVLVSGPRRIQLTSKQKIGVAGLVALVFLAFIWIDHSVASKGSDKPPALSIDPNLTDFRAAPITLPPASQPAIPAPQAPQAGEVSPAASPLFAYAANASSNSDSPAAPPGSDARASGQERVPSIADRNASGNAGDPSSALTSRMKPSTFEPTQAELLPHPDMLITKGTIIPCTLQTAIDTQLAGFVKCVLPEAVRSTTGNVVLLDRGTTVVGEIQSGLAQGQNRVFILWDRAETPDHAIVSLASPGADELGRAGMPGTVNTHFWQRFGGALMLSVVKGAMQVGTAFAANAGGGNGNHFNNLSSSDQQMTDTFSRNSMNIPPTLVKHQGDNVSIFVARDIDFSGIYRLGLTH